MRKWPITLLEWGTLAALLILPVIALRMVAGSLEGALLWGGVWALAASAISYHLMAHDKRCAIQQERRTPEAVLHALELCGGWPGSYLAQRRFRHKRIKITYQFTFLGVVALYQAVAWLLIDTQIYL